MTTTSEMGAIRMRAAIYVAGPDRVDRCERCVYVNGGSNHSDFWCRAHSVPTTKNSICAVWELRTRTKAIPCGATT